MRLYGADDRGVGDLQDAVEVDPIGVQPSAEIPVLVIGQALPVGIRHVADRNGLVVGISGVVAEFDGQIRIIDVAQAIEARIEGTDESAGRIVDGRGEPPLGSVVQLLAGGATADDAT